MNSNKMKRYILLLLIFTASSIGAARAYNSSPYVADSLQRELTLQKEYVPVGHQAERTTFNPLDTRGKASLTPIEFAKNTYQVGMNVKPKLFEPIQNPLAPNHPMSVFHARLFGGYPIYAGANIGFAGRIGEKGSLLLGLDHASRMNTVRGSVTPFDPQNTTHDSEIGLKYTQALESRLLNIGIEVYNHLNTIYGHAEKSPLGNLNSQLKGDEDFQEKYKLFRLTGGELSVSLSPTPLSLLSGWQYSAKANVGISNKAQPFYMNEIVPIISFDGNGRDANDGKAINELNLNLEGNLGYNFAGTDWGFGVDGKYQLLSLSELNVSENMKAGYIFSANPYFQYNSPNLLIKAGAKLQMLNRGEKTFLATPDVELRWKATPLFSLYAVADGGAELMGLRELYQVNRYAEASSAYRGYNITQYRALLGILVGNYDGFSLDINAGYADYLAFSDWDIKYTEAPMHPTIAHDPYDVVTFNRVNKGGANQIFVSALARYVSYIGLDLSAALKYNKYTRKEVEGVETAPIQGLPSMEMSINADYAFTEKLSAGASFNGLSGINFYQNINGKREEIKMSFIPELDARVSYKVHKNIGLSVIGKNIFNNKSARWAFYERPGATIVGAITFNL